MRIFTNILLVLFPFILGAQNILYTMPAEDTPHEATWLQWPHNNTFPPFHISDNEPAFVEMTAALVASEKVNIVVYDTIEKDRVEQVLVDEGISLANIEFFVHPNDDYWVRDNGPIFVYDGNNNLTVLDFGFNGWGGDAPYTMCDEIPNLIATDLGLPVVDLSAIVIEGGAIEIDGHGSVMITRSSTTGIDRNPNLTESQIEDYLTTYLGVTHFIWLDGQFGGMQDITDMHIDGLAKFIDTTTIITLDSTDLSYWGLSNQDINTLLNANDKHGNPYSFVYLPLTQNDVVTTWGSNLNFKGSYANYYIANDVVLVPTYDDPNDATALQIIQNQYPNRATVGIDCRNLFAWGGMVHCVTQQQPVNLHATAVEEHNSNKQLLQIVDVLGRKAKEDSKQLLFYIFDNGIVEKKIQIID